MLRKRSKIEIDPNELKRREVTDDFFGAFDKKLNKKLKVQKKSSRNSSGFRSGFGSDMRDNGIQNRLAHVNTLSKSSKSLISKLNNIGSKHSDGFFILFLPKYCFHGF